MSEASREGGPFRELFVEVPQALLEAAVIEAQQRQAKAPLQERLQIGQVGRLTRLLPALIEAWHGWSQVEALRSPYDAVIHIGGTAPCGHRAVTTLDERVAWVYDTGDADHATGDADHASVAISRAVENAARRCLCVQREDR